jgi:hypothetical protein
MPGAQPQAAASTPATMVDRTTTACELVTPWWEQRSIRHHAVQDRGDSGSHSECRESNNALVTLWPRLLGL